ncbi:uncharacterized protein METZ01_LOCUS322502, partial [marine metagenome]
VPPQHIVQIDGDAPFTVIPMTRAFPCTYSISPALSIAGPVMAVVLPKVLLRNQVIPTLAGRSLVQRMPE